MIEESVEGQSSDSPTTTSATAHTGSGTAVASEEDIKVVRETAFKVARNRGLDHSDADDIAQIVTEKLINLETQPDLPIAWARRVATNAVTDQARKRRIVNSDGVWVPREFPPGEDNIDSLRDVAIFIQTQRTVSAQGMQGKASEEMETLLREKLSERELQLARMLAEGRTHQQIADALGYASADSVKTTVKRMRGKIKGFADQLAEFGTHPRPY